MVGFLLLILAVILYLILDTFVVGYSWVTSRSQCNVLQIEMYIWWLLLLRLLFGVALFLLVSKKRYCCAGTRWIDWTWGRQTDGRLLLKSTGSHSGSSGASSVFQSRNPPTRATSQCLSINVTCLIVVIFTLCNSVHEFCWCSFYIRKINSVEKRLVLLTAVVCDHCFDNHPRCNTSL